MTCILFFHKWGKWSDVKNADFIYEGQNIYAQPVQFRYCAKCNKRDWRYA